MPTSDIPSSNSGQFRIAETDGFRKRLEKNPDLKRIYKKITEYAYPLLRENPYYGPNIKRLRGDLSDFYRFRIGNYRLFYVINQNENRCINETCPDFRETTPVTITVQYPPELPSKLI